jgi:hypothetical protein
MAKKATRAKPARKTAAKKAAFTITPPTEKPEDPKKVLFDHIEELRRGIESGEIIGIASATVYRDAQLGMRTASVAGTVGNILLGTAIGYLSFRYHAKVLNAGA